MLNLAVLDVKDADTASGVLFKRFIKRYNVFNTILANGKGFAFLFLPFFLLHEHLSRMLVKGLLVPLLNSG